MDSKNIICALCIMLLFVCTTNCANENNRETDDVVVESTQIFSVRLVDHIRAKLQNSRKNDVMVVAHRGDWRNAPENSLRAIENSIAMGVDIVEIDIKKTKDGKLVLMHDKNLDRTTTGLGLVSNWTLDSLKTLRLRNGTGRPTDHRIPTLKEAMLVAKGRIMVNLDHCYDYFSEAYEVLEETNTINHVIMKGYNKPVNLVKNEFGQYLDDVIFMPIINLCDPAAQSSIQLYREDLRPAAYEFVFESDTSALINSFDELKMAGSRVWVNALWAKLNGGHDDDLAVTDVENSYGWIIRKGANIIQTDRPEMLLDYLRSKGLHN